MFNATWLYVAALYALAVWLARRAGIGLPWRVASFFYLLVFVFLFKPLTGDYVNLPADFLKTMSPWAFLTHDHRAQNPEINDLVLQIVPWAHQVRESWRALHVPLWNSMSGSGYPLLANAQSSALSPFRILGIPLTLGQSFAFEAAAKILVALTFTFLFCRRRYSELASAAAAVCFGFCSFLVVWLHFPLAMVAAFVPAALYQIDLLAEKRTYGRFAFAAVLWAVMIFCGHPETVAHIFFISLLYVGWIVFVDRPFSLREAARFLVTLGGALAVAALLAAPFLAPVAEAITKSRRFNELKESPNVIGYYSDWPSIILLLQPKFSGNVPFEKPWGPATAESITGFAGVLGIAAWAALLVHVIRKRAWRSREAFFVLATVVVLGIVLGWPVVSQLFHFVFKLAANARLRLLLCFLVAVMTGAAIDLLERGERRDVLIGIAACAALLLYVFVTAPFPGGADRDAALTSLLPSLLVLLLAVVTAIPGRVGAAASLVLVAAIVGEIWSATAGWNPVVSASEMYKPTPLIDSLTALRDKQPAASPFRIVGLGPMFFPNVAAIYGLEDIRAHDPMSNARYLGMLRVLSGYQTEDYFPRWTNTDTRVLDYLNVRYVLTPPKAALADTQRYGLVYDGRDGRIFENHDVLPRFFPVRNVILEFKNERFLQLLQTHRDWAHTALLKNLKVDSDRMRTDLLAPRPADERDAVLTMTSAGPSDFRMRVTAPRYTLVVSSIPWWPGWKVVRDGKKTIEPIHLNGAFTGFVVPPGTSEIHVWYSPVTFWAGMWVSVATLVGLIGGLAFSVYAERSEASPVPSEGRNR